MSWRGKPPPPAELLKRVQSGHVLNANEQWALKNISNVHRRRRNETTDPHLEAETWGEIIDREDHITLRKAVSTGQLPQLRRPPTREVIRSTFVHDRELAQRTLRNADAAAAMRHLRRRVEQLNGPNASEPSDFAYQLINSPPKPTPIGSGSMQHPLLAAHEMVDPRVVQERSARPRRIPIEPTSLWCMSWGANADEQLVNFNYVYPTGRNEIGAWMPTGSIRRVDILPRSIY